MTEFTQILKTVGVKHQHEYTLYSSAKQPQGRARTASAPGLMPFLTDLAEQREHIHEKDGPMFTGPMLNDYRNKANAQPRTFGALDLDGVNIEELKAISAMFAGAGAFYPTYSNSRGNKEGLKFYRGVFNLGRPVTPEEYEKAQAALLALILENVRGLYTVENDQGEAVTIELDQARPVTFLDSEEVKHKTPLDTAAGVAAQAMYTPAFDAFFVASDSKGEPHRVKRGAMIEELSLDVDYLLSKYEEQEAKKRVLSTLEAPAMPTPIRISQPASMDDFYRPDIDQRIIGALMMNGLYIGPHKSEENGHRIRCPWANQHTSPGSEAIFYASSPGKAWAFFCHHTTHGKKSAAEFLAVIGLDNELLTGEAIRKERREAYQAARETAQMARYSAAASIETDYPGELAEARRSENKAPQPCPFVPLADELEDIDAERAEWIERLDTGIKSINELFDGGIKQRCLVMIAAMAGSGKTALIHQMADNIAKAHPVLFYSLEVTKAELTARAYRRIAYSHNTEARELSKKDIENRLALSPADPMLTEVKNIYRESAKNFYFRDIDTPTIEWIEHDIARFEKETGQSPVIFVDYLQLLRSEDTRLQDVARINHVANKLKNLAKRLPVIVISSMNRANYQKDDPGQSAFKGSGDLEYSAHAGIVITTEEINGEKIHNIALVKARDLPPREQPVQMKYVGHAFYFTEIPASELAYLRDWKEADKAQQTKAPRKVER